eukprot:TRINITY_DN6629_c0_g1_i1.p1 TRINITY_DN6629_c0_g1~~TRINITY_DN6629_c0_g1_i1.p1  ORF type:complete len:111 (-),score=0.73 TRINITY_DN6629_c0_g1_i1:103-435(-)
MFDRAPFDENPGCTIPRPDPPCRNPDVSVVPTIPGNNPINCVASRPFSGNSRIRRSSTTAPNVDVCVSTRAASAFTCTDSVTCPTCSATSIRATCPTASTMPDRVMERNP